MWRLRSWFENEMSPVLLIHQMTIRGLVVPWCLFLIYLKIYLSLTFTTHTYKEVHHGTNISKREKLLLVVIRLKRVTKPSHWPTARQIEEIQDHCYSLYKWWTNQDHLKSKACNSVRGRRGTQSNRLPILAHKLMLTLMSPPIIIIGIILLNK